MTNSRTSRRRSSVEMESECCVERTTAEMRQRDGQGHELGRLVAREAEHEALIACTLLLFPALIDAHGDVRRLPIDAGQDRAGGPIKAHLAAVEADVPDRLARDRRIIDLGSGRDFPGDADVSGRDHRLAGHSTRGVLLKERVEDGVGDGVGDLVRMALCDGF